MKKVFAL